MAGTRVISSLANLISGYTVTCPSEDSAFPATNLKTPQSVFYPARTTVATTTHWQIDRLASGTPMGIISLHRTNFLTATLLGSNDVNFGTIPYSQAFTIARSVNNGRYNSEIIPTNFTYRYARISVGTQTPVAESMNVAESVFLLGGIWIGDIVYLPRNFVWDIEYSPLFPRVSLEAPHGGHEQVLIKGNQRARFTGTRIAMKIAKAAPFTANDELSRYMDYDRRCFEAEYFLLYLNTGAPGEVFVVRHAGDSPTWKMIRHHVAESSFDLKELMGS